MHEAPGTVFGVFVDVRNFNSHDNLKRFASFYTRGNGGSVDLIICGDCIASIWQTRVKLRLSDSKVAPAPSPLSHYIDPVANVWREHWHLGSHHGVIV